MSSEIILLILSATSIAFLHTVSGPDHYLPFVALSRSRGWSVAKTMRWTMICGLGHIASSVLLGLGGAALGWSLSSVSWLENVRGGIAGWLMLLFGLVYGCWGLWRAYRDNPHKHFDLEAGGDIYVYEHKHGSSVRPAERHKLTPWVMFIIFILGPCEPLIPLLFFPAAKNNWSGMLLLIIIYSFVTLGTMLALVLFGRKGTLLFKTAVLERHMHSLGGLAIFICGAGMLFMGW